MRRFSTGRTIDDGGWRGEKKDWVDDMVNEVIAFVPDGLLVILSLKFRFVISFRGIWKGMRGLYCCCPPMRHHDSFWFGSLYSGIELVHLLCLYTWGDKMVLPTTFLLTFDSQVVSLSEIGAPLSALVPYVSWNIMSIFGLSCSSKTSWESQSLKWWWNGGFSVTGPCRSLAADQPAKLVA